MAALRHIISLVLAASVIGSCTGSNEPSTQQLVIFHAHSLSIPMKEAAAAFEALRPDISVELEPGGSLDSARKISELGRRCDVFASADVEVIQKLLIPDHASWYLAFASNEIVLAYRRDLDERHIPAEDNWVGLLLNPDLNYGRSDPDAEPIGYRSILMLKLAEKFYDEPGAAQMLLEKDTQFMRPNPAALIALLETGAVDFALVYRSMAIQNQVPFLELPPELNLGDPEQTARYATVRVEVAGERPGERLTIQGTPILYGLTIPRNAPNPALAEAFLQYLLSKEGLDALERNHQKPVVPATTPNFQAIPDSLKPFTRPAGP